MSDTHEVTRLLGLWAKGNSQALNDLTPIVYGELRQLAAHYLRREQQANTLQPTALVHEAYLRLVDQKNPSFENRSHFYGVAARLMRQILVDHARRRMAGKRAGVKVPLEEVVTFHQDRSRDRGRAGPRRPARGGGVHRLSSPRVGRGVAPTGGCLRAPRGWDVRDDGTRGG